jgi:AraC-like DNA-binding protein
MISYLPHLALLHAQRVQLDARWRYEGVVSPFSRIYLITEGAGWVFHHGTRHELRPGNLYLIPRYTMGTYHCDDYLVQSYLHVLDDSSAGVALFDAVPLRFQVPATELDHHLVNRLLALHPQRSLQHPDPRQYDNRPDLLSFNQPAGPDWAVELETSAILLQLASRFFDPMPKAGFGNDRWQGLHQLSPVLGHVHEHLAEPLSVKALAERCHLHPDYFSRRFKALTGLPPMTYLMNKRLERAQLLLTTSRLSLQAIAEQTGLGNVYYFSRLFARRFGTPPGKYRQSAWLGQV